MHLSQSKYIQDFLERTHLDDSKPTLLQVVLVGQFHKQMVHPYIILLNIKA